MCRCEVSINNKLLLIDFSYFIADHSTLLEVKNPRVVISLISHVQLFVVSFRMLQIRGSSITNLVNICQIQLVDD